MLAWILCFVLFLALFVICTHVLDRKCNPSLLGIIGLNSTSPTGQDQVVQWWDAQGIVGLILFLMCVLYSRWESASQNLSAESVHEVTVYSSVCGSAFETRPMARWTSSLWQVMSRLWSRMGRRLTALKRTGLPTELWTMRRMASPTHTLSSTSCCSWRHCTSWWLWPTGTGRPTCHNSVIFHSFQWKRSSCWSAITGKFLK